jgi:hypothetical protein
LEENGNYHLLCHLEGEMYKDISRAKQGAYDDSEGDITRICKLVQRQRSRITTVRSYSPFHFVFSL